MHIWSIVHLTNYTIYLHTLYAATAWVHTNSCHAMVTIFTDHVEIYLYSDIVMDYIEVMQY